MWGGVSVFGILFFFWGGRGRFSVGRCGCLGTVGGIGVERGIWDGTGWGEGRGEVRESLWWVWRSGMVLVRAEFRFEIEIGIHMGHGISRSAWWGYIGMEDRRVDKR